MSDHVIHAKVVVEAGTDAVHAIRKDQLDQAVVFSVARENHTGTQTIDTISDAQTYVDGRIALVVGAAPAALDTLVEIAEALGNDPDLAGTLTTQITSLDSRLDTLEGAPTGTHKATIGNGSASTFTVTHSLGSTDVAVEVFKISDGKSEHPVITRTGVNTVFLDYGSTVPASSSYRVLVRLVP